MKSATYEEFVDKFKPKLTTDDCYTPPNVYDAVVGWVVDEYGVNQSDFVRPFYPGGDYERYEYKDTDIVVDNPPFSILSKITNFYVANGIRFFLFAPTLTIFGAGRNCCSIPVASTVTYANGANVNTSFLTNLENGIRFRTAPELYKRIKVANDENTRGVELPKYDYPDEVITSAFIARLSKYGVDFAVPTEECEFIRALDSQRKNKKAIFGAGYLISSRAAAERAAAERAAAERAAAERAAATKWALSEREREIINKLTRNGTEEKALSSDSP